MNLPDLSTITEALGSISVMDSVVIIVAVVAAGIGFCTGFVWQIIRVVSILVVFLIAARYHEDLAGRFADIGPEQLRLVACYLILFVGGLIATYLIAFLVRKPIKALKPELSDRVVGAGLGLIKGVLLCGILALAIMRYPDGDSALRRQLDSSRLAKLSARCAQVLYNTVSRGESAD
ncbi:MAG: CvpA family protein [Candidatus Brocadiia bacterium]|jgi:membrane protein required for colicin V production|nr:CvpA family protein [Candidatus Brocadiia bacterium]